MPMLLHPLPHRRRSRRRMRNLSARALFATVVLLLCAYSAWRPSATSADTLSTTPSALPDIVLSGPEPEESVDTEGALAEDYRVEDAGRYVAGR